jgi:hypothetical protein
MKLKRVFVCKEWDGKKYNKSIKGIEVITIVFSDFIGGMLNR